LTTTIFKLYLPIQHLVHPRIRETRKRTTRYQHQPQSHFIMPHLPFTNAIPSPSSSPKATLNAPSIVLHPATGILDRSNNDFPSNLATGASSKRDLYKSSDDVASQYRARYAQYLAATFSMSLEAAMAEADTQLAPRRSSGCSEAEALRES
jgi:hypothetical protein